MILLNKCFASCWCYYCDRQIKKDEKFLKITKQVVYNRRARINICRECLIEIFLELMVKNKELGEIKSKIILDRLGNKK